METMVSVQIWSSPEGVERVWGLGEPEDRTALPLLNGARHYYVRNELRQWQEFKQGEQKC